MTKYAGEDIMPTLPPAPHLIILRVSNTVALRTQDVICHDKSTTEDPRPVAEEAPKPPLCARQCPPHTHTFYPQAGRGPQSHGDGAQSWYLKPDKWEGSTTRRRPDLTKYDSSLQWHIRTSAVQPDPRHSASNVGGTAPRKADLNSWSLLGSHLVASVR